MSAALFPSDPLYPPENERRPPILPPPCASAWGDDTYGLWVDVEIAGVVQRLRWIEPGEFWMGSPEEEAERVEREGPRHGVRLTAGFWLADTACTQALWQAVMGENPSRFKDDPLNPVENVSWDDANAFLQRVGSILPGVEAALPSEAEWEYACRAGSETPFNVGETISAEQANYNGNFPYAGGEKGVNRGKTVPVKSFTPNAWGLHQMHGNVWEWCADEDREYDAEVQHDPRGREDEEAARVMRGGPWDHEAWGLRSAFRPAWGRHVRVDRLGFRFSLRSTSPDQEACAPRWPQRSGLTRDA